MTNGHLNKHPTSYPNAPIVESPGVVLEDRSSDLSEGERIIDIKAREDALSRMLLSTGGTIIGKKYRKRFRKGGGSNRLMWIRSRKDQS